MISDAASSQGKEVGPQNPDSGRDYSDTPHTVGLASKADSPEVRRRRTVLLSPHIKRMSLYCGAQKQLFMSELLPSTSREIPRN
jgi:hypothetical protein